MLRKIKDIKVIIRYYWNYDKLYTILFFFRCIVGAIISTINSIYLLKVVFDAFETSTNINYIIEFILLIAGINVIYFLFNEWFQNIYKPKCDLKVKSLIQKELFVKAAKIDLSYYDNPKFYNDYILALNESKKRAEDVMEHCGQCISNITSIISISSIILKIDYLVIILIIISVFISLVFDTKMAQTNASKEFDLIGLNRRINYIKRIFYLREFITEMKIMHNENFIFDEYDESVKSVEKINSEYGKRLMKMNLSSGVITSILTNYVVYFLLIHKMFVLRTITIGDFSAILSSIWGLTNMLSQVVNNISALIVDSIYCKKISEFIQISNCTKPNYDLIKPPEELTTVELCDVSFSYNKSNKVLKNINLKIEAGQKIAIVGENGAGKSTLINVLLNLYKDYTGTININGVDIKKYDNEALYEYFSCLFQDFNIYASSIENNVCMNLCGEDNLSNIEEALKIAGFEEKLRKLPLGVHTVLTNEYDENGLELSGGEKHKIAMARIIISKGKVICLDEPSSSLDPIGESNFNRILMSAFKDKTVIFISHRFFANRFVDKIYMMSDGRIIEEGTHNKLMKDKGRYSVLYNLQKEKFKLDKN